MGQVQVQIFAFALQMAIRVVFRHGCAHVNHRFFQFKSLSRPFTDSCTSSSTTTINQNNTHLTMENVTDIRCGQLPADSPYVKPFRMYFKQNGVEKNWDLLKVHDSVSIIIFNKTRQTLVFVKQFRPCKCNILIYINTISRFSLSNTRQCYVLIRL